MLPGWPSVGASPGVARKLQHITDKFGQSLRDIHSTQNFHTVLTSEQVHILINCPSNGVSSVEPHQTKIFTLRTASSLEEVGDTTNNFKKNIVDHCQLCEVSYLGLADLGKTTSASPGEEYVQVTLAPVDDAIRLTTGWGQLPGYLHGPQLPASCAPGGPAPQSPL